MLALRSLLPLPALLALACGGGTRAAPEPGAAAPPGPDPALVAGLAPLPVAPRPFVPAEPEREPTPEEIAAIERPSVRK